MRPLLAAVAFGAICTIGAGIAVHTALAAPPARSPAALPDKVRNFQLTDHTRLAHELYYFRETPAIVIMTQVNGSEMSRAAVRALQDLSDSMKDSGAKFFLLNSVNSREAVAAEIRALNATVPALIDELQIVGRDLGVSREAEVFVIDPKSWKIAFHGPLDDRFSKTSPNATAQVKAAYVRDAVNALVAGKVPSKGSVTLTSGKAIEVMAVSKPESVSSIAYATEIAPILKQKCVVCHQDGGVAPFVMHSYDVIKNFAPMIRESIITERMPPYFADPHIGAFKNDQSLSADQTKTLIRWLDAGAPRGEGGDPLKELAAKASEWPEELGKPDMIIDLPAFDVPASGVVDYKYPKVANPFTGDVWLKAMVIKPGAIPVVHHVTSSYRADPKLPPPKIMGGSVGSYAPGGKPQVMPASTGAPVPAGGHLEFSMHYTPIGKEMVDRTQVGFYLHKTPPTFINRAMVIQDLMMSIPAGEARHKETSYLEFPADAWLYTLAPHAHYRGYNVELKARTPDGAETILLSLPKYDFNWQREYDPVEPILVKAGTKLIATWIFDNSTANRANPDPKQVVTWGEQSWEEMMYFRVNYRWADETVASPRNEIQQQLVRGRLLGQLDDNIDGLVQKDELVGGLAVYRERFEAMDSDRNGGLDAAEMAAADLTRQVMKQLERREAETPNL